MRNPCAQLLNVSHQVKVTLYGTVRAFHDRCQSPHRLAWIFVSKLIKSLLIELNAAFSAMRVFEVETAIFEARLNQFGAILRDIASSPYTSQISLAAFVALAPWINAKSRRCRKYSFLSTWHSILMTWKEQRIAALKKTEHCFVEHIILYRIAHFLLHAKFSLQKINARTFRSTQYFYILTFHLDESIYWEK